MTYVSSEAEFRAARRGEFSGNGLPDLDDWRVEWRSFWDRDREADWLVEPVIARGRSHSVNAKAEGGKSLLFQEIAFAVATGRPVLHRPASEPLVVVYLDLEMTEDDLDDRADSFGYGPADDLSHLRYILLPDLPPLDTANGGDALLAYAEKVGADLVVIDTTARVLEGNENDADTLRDFHRHTGQRLKAAGITWVRLDHLGKEAERGARGTSAKNDDVDVVWQLTKGDAGVTLTAKKRRVRWIPENVALAVLTEPHTTHRATPKVWAAGTQTLADLLDRLEVPVGASKRAARAALANAGEKARNTTLLDALRWRRDQSIGES